MKGIENTAKGTVDTPGRDSRDSRDSRYLEFLPKKAAGHEWSQDKKEATRAATNFQGHKGGASLWNSHGPPCALDSGHTAVGLMFALLRFGLALIQFFSVYPVLH